LFPEKWTEVIKNESLILKGVLVTPQNEERGQQGQQGQQAQQVASGGQPVKFSWIGKTVS